LSRKKASKRFGRIVFFIPTLVVLAVAAFGIISFISIQTGTIVVEATSSGRYAASIQLHPYVSVGGKTEQSPFNLTLPQGQYTVEFGQLTWYLTPAARSVAVSGGKTQYAVAVYDPVVRVISMSSAGFNSTSVTAEHGLTPVIWVNISAEVFTLNIQGLARVSLNPGENYTAIFSSQGTFSYSIPSTSYSGTVHSE
jgi:energy-converting hydrogenase Eha subunit F